MENGARGATNNQLEMRSYSSNTRGQAMESRSRELCDIIISHDLEEKLMNPLMQTNLFDNKKSCVLKVFNVEMPSAIYHYKSEP